MILLVDSNVDIILDVANGDADWRSAAAMAETTADSSHEFENSADLVIS